MLESILTIIVFLPILVISKEHWSYENMPNWSNDNHYCRGNRQSPIDLRFNLSQYEPRLQQIYVEKKSSHNSPILVNNGHTAQLNLNNTYIIHNVAVSDGDYVVEQLHFHWGHSNNNTDGSEHLLETQAYPLEMHVVSYSKSFSAIKDALPNVRALAVIGVFFELSDEPNKHLEPIIDSLKYIPHNGSHHLISNQFNLIPLLGGNPIRRYYRYDGSLTTPPCYESVIWTVLPEPLKISSDQLKVFRTLHEDRYKLMKNTYRPIQPLGARKLFRSFFLKDKPVELKDRQFTSGNDGQYSSTFFVITSFIMIMII